MDVEPIHRRGLMLVLSSPSGAGKSTIAKEILARDNNIAMSVSMTTRPKRPGEVAGRDYNFVDKADFNLMVNRREFLEIRQGVRQLLWNAERTGAGGAGCGP